MEVKNNSIILKLSENRLKKLIDFAKDYAVCHGILVRTSSEPESSDVANIMSMTLLPTPVKQTLFNFGKQIQPDYNYLYHKIAHDHHFLKEALGRLRSTDDFIKRLYDIYESVQNEPSSICLEISRSDYMIDSREGHVEMMKQIEYNTIAVGAAGLAKEVSHYHKYLLEKMGQSDLANVHLPENEAIDDIASGIVTAWEMYDAKEAVILFVIEPSPRNIFDVRTVEFGVHKLNPNIEVVFTSFLELDEKATLRSDNKLVFEDQEVALVYYRTGYVPKDYTSETEWKVRLMVERSKAIKCPTVAYQLVGMKKVQQVLTNPGIVERYIKDPEVSHNIRKTFAQQYSLEGIGGDEAIKLAMENPDNFVLKPQREGGGNNIYGADIITCLNKIKGTEERRNYVLMERIRPLVSRNHILRPNVTPSDEDTISEIGIFGVLISSGETILQNKGMGYLMRTKTHSIDEGTILSGCAGVGSVFLV